MANEEQIASKGHRYFDRDSEMPVFITAWN
jgi:hypothetical protein